MSLSTLQAELSTAISKREAVAARIRELRTRASVLEADVTSAEAAAEQAQGLFDVALRSNALGEKADVASARKARDAAVRAFDEGRHSLLLVEQTIESLERQHEQATKSTAAVAERVAVAIARRRERSFRAAAVVLGEEARDFHRACFAADNARRLATGHLGEPIAHTGFRAAQLQMDRHDPGIPGIWAAAGLAADLTPNASRIAPLTEAELLVPVDDDTTTEGDALTATETT